MTDRTLLQAAAESSMEAIGASLANSLYTPRCTIGLFGPLGVGKTTFLRGFLQRLGVSDPVVSPTYALEQRYSTPRYDVLHIDLYRLDERAAQEMVHASDDWHGIRCIEWPNRAGEKLQTDITVHIREEPSGTRIVTVECNDAQWPDDHTIDAWRSEMMLPANVGQHCDAVAGFCKRLEELLVQRGTFVRGHLLRAAARTHDLLRFVDFQPNASPPGSMRSPQEQSTWLAIMQQYPHLSHEEAACSFLRERGFPILGDLVGSHTVHLPVAERTTTEAHILYYADKRFIGDRFVTVAERYADFAIRYGNGTRSAESRQWEQDALDTERLLFPDGLSL